MVEGLPLDSPLARARNGTYWLDGEWLLHDVSSQLRNLNASVHNIVQSPPVQPQFLPKPTPLKSAGDEAQEALDAEEQAREQAHMDSIWARVDPNRR